VCFDTHQDPGHPRGAPGENDDKNICLNFDSNSYRQNADTPGDFDRHRLRFIAPVSLLPDLHCYRAERYAGVEQGTFEGGQYPLVRLVIAINEYPLAVSGTNRLLIFH
jgi:hypothetical protein